MEPGFDHGHLSSRTWAAASLALVQPRKHVRGPHGSCSTKQKSATAVVQLALSRRRGACPSRLPGWPGRTLAASGGKTSIGVAENCKLEIVQYSDAKRYMQTTIHRSRGHKRAVSMRAEGQTRRQTRTCRRAAPPRHKRSRCHLRTWADNGFGPAPAALALDHDALEAADQVAANVRDASQVSEAKSCALRVKLSLTRKHLEHLALLLGAAAAVAARRNEHTLRRHFT